MNELQDYLKTLPRILMIKTLEEDRLIEDIHKSVGKGPKGHTVTIWNSCFGVMRSPDYIDEWATLNHPMDKDSVNIHQYLQDLYKQAQSADNKSLYALILDAERYVEDKQIQRRLKNIALTGSHNDRVERTVILVSATGHVPAYLEPYIMVHDFDDPSDDLIRSIIMSIEKKLQEALKDLPAGKQKELGEIRSAIPFDREGNTVPQSFIDACRGLTVFQIKETLMHFIGVNNGKVFESDMRNYRKGIIKKTQLLDLMETDITFDDVAGLDKLKQRLREIRTAWTPEGREYGVPVSRGLLQVGVPGCGKSMIAKALANEMGVTFVRFDPSNLFSSAVGDSERNMRSALRYIEAVAPAIVFIDEIEKGLAGIQSSSYSDSGTTARVIGTFLSWFQDHSSEIFIIATANGVGNLPPELISRFEEKFFVGMPGRLARKACFDIQLRKYWKDSMGDLSDIDLDELADASRHLTGREIEQVICDSIRKAFHTDDKLLTTEILLTATRTKPPLVQTMAEEIEELIGWVGWDPVRKEGVRAIYASSEEIVEVEVDAATSNRLLKVFGNESVN